MQTSTLQANPFAMLLDLDAVVRTMEHSERLNRLHSRIYRPLDKPLIPNKGVISAADFDRMIDDAPEEAEPADEGETLMRVS